MSFVSAVLPLGISFYSFQLLAYQIDCARGRIPPDTRASRFVLFITFFPQLIAGPIVRAHQLLPQLSALFRAKGRRVRLITFGLGLCCLGLVKKIILADSLAPFVDDIFLAVPDNAFVAWTGAWLFAFQIYFDFSGYCDIAIGCAFLLGLRLPTNFRTPYLSTSPREFWQRWHITLSTCIRDYLYIPFGGNKGGLIRQFVVLVAVMGIAGLWHGAGWTFVVWGTLWGIYMGVVRAAQQWLGAPNRETVVPRPLGFMVGLSWLPHLAVVLCLWVFFRAPNIEFAITYVGVMFGAGSGAGLWPQWPLAAAGGAGLMLLHLGESRLLGHGRRTDLGVDRSMIVLMRRLERPLWRGLLAEVCFWLVVLPTYGNNPFIYFRF